MRQLRYPRDGIYVKPSDSERHFLMWYAYNEGHNLLCASSLESLSEMYRQIRREHSDAKAVHYWVGKFVDIPEFLKEKWEAAVYLDELSTFRSKLSHYFRYYMLKNGEPPEGVELCSDYQIADYMIEDCPEDEVEDMIASYEKDHFSCTTCDGYRFKSWNGLNYEQLFRRNREAVFNKR